MTEPLAPLLKEIAACRVCRDLPLGPRPVLAASKTAKILIAGQAPGVRVHKSGVPFDDPSGERLRAWMGINREVFYDKNKISIIPMGFCYPGSAPRGGDLPPRPECRATWHGRLFKALSEFELTLVIGQYAHEFHLSDRRGKNLTETVQRWQEFYPKIIPMPHPSPRNIFWLKRNPWFEVEVIPALQQRIKEILKI